MQLFEFHLIPVLFKINTSTVSFGSIFVFLFPNRIVRQGLCFCHPVCSVHSKWPMIRMVRRRSSPSCIGRSLSPALWTMNTSTWESDRYIQIQYEYLCLGAPVAESFDAPNSCFSPSPTLAWTDQWRYSQGAGVSHIVLQCSLTLSLVLIDCTLPRVSPHIQSSLVWEKLKTTDL